eukprot:XP_011667849.1 PREDICTED: uncharacterized protein LOC105439971 [Strongylocentrotus purpuratus]
MWMSGTPGNLQGYQFCVARLIDGWGDQFCNGLRRFVCEISKGCPPGKWNVPICDRLCDNCYNGGVCNPHTGACICTHGFTGKNCLTACGDQRFGSECELVCGSAIADDSSCSDNKFCLPGPNDCSCIAGYTGAFCNEVTETWFSETNPASACQLPLYHLFHKDRRGQKGGGVALYVRDDMNPTEVFSDTVPPHLEALWVRLRSSAAVHLPKDIFVGVIYSPPRSPHRAEMIEHIINMVDRARLHATNASLIIMGDFNDLETDEIERHTSLSQIVKEPTRESAILDKILTDLNEDFCDPQISTPIASSDHNVVTVLPCLLPPPRKSTRTSHRPFRDSSVRAFGQWVQQMDWSIIGDFDANDMASEFNDLINTKFRQYFELVTVKRRLDDEPWMNDEIRRAINRRDSSFRHGHPDFKRLRNHVQRLIDNAKDSFYQRKVEHLKKSEPGKWHQQIRHLAGIRKKQLNLSSDGRSDIDIANELNTHFAAICSSLPPLDRGALSAFLPAPSPPPVIDRRRVYKRLCGISTAKACHPNDPPSRLLKEFAYELSEPLTTLFNLCLSQASFPTERRPSATMGNPLNNKPSPVGYPQGTRLGPVLFLVLINDAALESDNRWKYVDDLTIVEVLKKTHPSELQSHLDSLIQWCKDNDVVPIAAKCKAMQISFLRQPPPPIVLDINSTTLEAVSSLKLLGVFLRDDLKWDGQVNRLISNASRRLYLLTKLRRNGVTTKDLATIYMLYNRPVLEFAAPVWTSGITNNHSVSIERVQRRALRIITYPDSRTYDELQSHLGVSSLKERRTSLSLRFAESLLQSKVHRHLLPESRVNDCSRILRNALDLSLPKMRTTRANLGRDHTMRWHSNAALLLVDRLVTITVRACKTLHTLALLHERLILTRGARDLIRATHGATMIGETLAAIGLGSRRASMAELADVAFRVG